VKNPHKLTIGISVVLVSATATFKTNKAGLTHMAFGEVEVPDKGISIQIQNFDYEPQN
jgi:hypothetical protein